MSAGSSTGDKIRFFITRLRQKFLKSPLFFALKYSKMFLGEYFIMYKFKFKYSTLVYVLLILTLALSLAGVIWNIFNV